MSKEGTGIVIGGLVLIALIVAFVLASTFLVYKRGYYEGQIDCVNGKKCIELKQQEDGSSRWTATQPASGFWTGTNRVQE